MNKSSKYSRLKNRSIKFLLCGCTIAFLFLGAIIGKYGIFKDESLKTNADGFNIESYQVILNVNEDNSIDVKEYVTVYFYESGHHGIYRFIPEWLEYTSKDGSTISRKSTISNLVSYSDKYTTTTINGKKQIKMGDSNKTLSIGTHTYVIGYTYDMGSDIYDGFDELIFHAFGDYWGTEIKNASVEINLPKDTDIYDNIHFFADKYRTNDITSYVYYTVSGNTIYATLSSTYELDSSLTIDIELPDGYFVDENENYGKVCLIICIICIVFAVISFLLWLKYGKDLDKVPETVEFYPPEQLDAAQIGYLYKNDTGRKLSIALIVELASKGFIKIIESDDKSKQTIVKNNDLDSNDKSKMTENEKIIYNQLFKDSDENVLSEDKKFYEVFKKVEENVKNELDDKINDLKAYRCMVLSSAGFAICTLLWGIAYCIIEDLDTKLSFLYYLAAISNGITFIFSILMSRKAYYGEQIKARINGFRNYLEIAERNQIELLVEKNPNYFYDILPYAYVLGISKKWIEKFENISVPTNDMGNFEYGNDGALDNLSSSVYYPSTSYGGGSGYGGGCSSCGGGCSSCGGGGSW